MDVLGVVVAQTPCCAIAAMMLESGLVLSLLRLRLGEWVPRCALCRAYRWTLGESSSCLEMKNDRI